MRQATRASRTRARFANLETKKAALRTAPEVDSIRIVTDAAGATTQLSTRSGGRHTLPAPAWKHMQSFTGGRAGGRGRPIPLPPVHQLPVEKCVCWAGIGGQKGFTALGKGAGGLGYAGDGPPRTSKRPPHRADHFEICCGVKPCSPSTSTATDHCHASLRTLTSVGGMSAEQRECHGAGAAGPALGAHGERIRAPVLVCRTTEGATCPSPRRPHPPPPPPPLPTSKSVCP